MRIINMTITVEEFEKNLDYYLEKANDEGITITRNGIPISFLISPEQYKKHTGKKIKRDI